MELRGKNFLIIGRAGMDLYPDPPGTKTEEAVNFFACLGGSSANIGVAITKLGGQASLVTRVADDAIQDEDTQAIRALNVKLQSDVRIDLSVVPIGDGLALARKK